MATGRRGSEKRERSMPARQSMSIRLPRKLYHDLKAMSEKQYQSINSLLVEFARDRVKQWKDDLAAESFSLRRRRRSHMEQEEQDVEQEDAE